MFFLHLDIHIYLNGGGISDLYNRRKEHSIALARQMMSYAHALTSRLHLINR